jgi:hypothetical protein
MAAVILARSAGKSGPLLALRAKVMAGSASKARPAVESDHGPRAKDFELCKKNKPPLPW